jgi:hypothetical protein
MWSPHSCISATAGSSPPAWCWLRGWTRPGLVGPLLYTSHVIGGGYRLVTQVQGAVHSGTVGCLVTDGERYFALTNEHVTGDPGRIVSAEIAGQIHRIGVSATNSLRKLPFEKAFPGLTGSDTESNLDVGLVDIDDIAQWSAQVFGLASSAP